MGCTDNTEALTSKRLLSPPPYSHTSLLQLWNSSLGPASFVHLTCTAGVNAKYPEMDINGDECMVTKWYKNVFAID